MAPPKPKDAEACKLTPCGKTPLRAASGRSQASAPLGRQSCALGSSSAATASELAGGTVPQGCLPAQPDGPAGGPVALALLTRNGALDQPPSFVQTFGITRLCWQTCAWR